MIQQAGSIDGRAVGKVTSHGKVQAHESVSGFEDGHGDGHVGLGAGMGLHIGILGIKQGAETVYGYLLYLVHHLAAAVIAFAGITFCILVGTDGTHGGKHLLRHIVLGGNEFQAGRLTFLLFFDKVENLEVFFHMWLSVLSGLQI